MRPFRQIMRRILIILHTAIPSISRITLAGQACTLTIISPISRVSVTVSFVTPTAIAPGVFPLNECAPGRPRCERLRLTGLSENELPWLGLGPPLVIRARLLKRAIRLFVYSFARVSALAGTPLVSWRSDGVRGVTYGAMWMLLCGNEKKRMRSRMATLAVIIPVSTVSRTRRESSWSVGA